MKHIKIIHDPFISMFCPCFLPGLDKKTSHVFDQYRITCFLERLHLKDDNSETIYIIYVGHYPIDLAHIFIQHLHYSFFYRLQQNLALPFDLINNTNLQENLDLKSYLNYLLSEYYHDIKHLNFNISNPLYKHEHIVYCSKSNYKISRKIILIPDQLY